MSTNEQVESATLTIDKVVFEPKHLIALLACYSLPTECGSGSSIEATGRQEVAELLEAVLGDWVDFAFVPAPKPFVIYADHDEYTTFYANTKSNLNGVVEALTAAGFQKVADYERKL